jgi:5'-nucleotidase (lipoprotein e(P4) family)
VRLQRLYFSSLCVLFANLCGCVKTSDEQDNLNAVLWVQTSSEFVAATMGTYANATAALRRMVADNPTTVDQMTVVMDIDQTILDSSGYPAQNILDHTDYHAETLDQYLALREGTALPGAVEFINASRDLGVDVFYITSRPCRKRTGNSDYCPQKEDTLVNLRQAGVEIDADELFLRSENVPERCLEFLSDRERQQGKWTDGDKTSRRQCVELDREIVMLIGDQLNDFIGGSANSTPESRKELVDHHKDNWGKTWFMIPNPTSGSWLNLLQPEKQLHLRGT